MSNRNLVQKHRKIKRYLKHKREADEFNLYLQSDKFKEDSRKARKNLLQNISVEVTKLVKNE